LILQSFKKLSVVLGHSSV